MLRCCKIMFRWELIFSTLKIGQTFSQLKNIERPMHSRASFPLFPMLQETKDTLEPKINHV